MHRSCNGKCLGNGCDEGSAPFVIGDSNEITGERVVEEPSLTAAGETITPSDPAPTAVADEAGAEPDDPGRGGEGDGDGGQRERNRGADDGSGESATAVDPAEGGGEDQGGRRNRDRGQGEGAAVADASGGERLSPVQRGDRPRRNPDLTEESGPVLPPPRNTRRLGAAQTAFVEVARIDAGALGVRDEKGNRRDRNRDRDRDRKANRAGTEQISDDRGADDTATDTRSGEADENRTRTNERRGEPLSDSGIGESEKPRSAERRAPVPLEEDAAPSPSPERSGGNARSEAETEPGDGAREGESANAADPAPGVVLGWQGADLSDIEPGDGGVPADDETGDGAPPATSDAPTIEAPSGDGEKPAKDAKRKRTKDRQNKRKANEAPPMPWSADADYRGGEATLLIDGEDVEGTDADDLYLTQRAGADRHRNGSFMYAIPVDEDGIYRVRLHFAETWFGAPGGPKGEAGKRVFDVDAEGEEALRDFDIYDEVGAMTAVVKMFDIEVDDGTLELEFIPVKDQPVVSAIEVLRADEAVPKMDRKDREKRTERNQKRAGQGGSGDGAQASAFMPWIDQRTQR